MDDLEDNRQNQGMRRRFLWSLLVATTVAYLAVIIPAFAGSAKDLNNVLWVWVMVPSTVVAGAILMWRRPENRVGELLTSSGIFMMVLPTMLELPTVSAYEKSGPMSWMWATIFANQMLTMCGVILLAILIVVLPDGRFRFDRERRFARWSWIVLLFPALSLISNEIVVKPEISFPGVTNIPSPVSIEALLPWGPIFGALTSLSYGVFGVAILFQFLRYRSAATRERRQIRWVLYAGVVGIALGLVPYLLGELAVIPPMQHNLSALLSALPMLLLPLSIVVAVLEPGWIDVDIVIRKSFVYGALSFFILLIYIAVAAAFGLAAGSRLRIEVAIFLTVIVAVAFQPLRKWLQGLADRLVFGDRPTKYAAVTEMSASIEGAPDPSELLPRLVDTLKRALRLEWAVARLDDGTNAEVGAVSGEPILRVPIESGSERLGVIECGPRSEGALDDEDVQLVRTLAGQAGLAMANARMAGRIVNAAEAERRRIERNIHDGAQQELVALVARLGMARAQADNGGVSSDELAQLQQAVRHILGELRDLAQGIHPSVLSDGGVLEAVEERCSHLPIEVSVEASPLLRQRRFSDEVEGAAYFFVTESLANVLKHAGASVVSVSLRTADGSLVLAVTDDGCGFDPAATRQNGLLGLRDRISALGGTVGYQTGPGQGTTITASLPVEQ